MKAPLKASASPEPDRPIQAATPTKMAEVAQVSVPVRSSLPV